MNNRLDKNQLISIIVPVYNVKKYLKECLNSIVSQTYTNLEIILVDDGSTDGSGEICDEFAKQEARIKVLHQKNAGQAVARNAGLDIMQGEYLSFVDSDDMIDETYIETLYNLIKKYNTKISMASYTKFKSQSEIANLKNFECVERIITPKDIFKGSCKKEKFYLTAIWRILYHKSIFKNLRFPSGKIHEDIAVWFDIFKNEKNIAISNKYIYFYRVNLNSTVRKKIDEKFFVIFENTQKFTDNIVKAYSDLQKEANYLLCHIKMQTIIKILKYDDEKYYSKINEYHKFLQEKLDIMFAIKSNFKFGLAMSFFHMSPKIFKFVYTLYKKLKDYKCK
ncbi:glycosyltransferase [Campylobacter sp. VBCF_05 NA6]|uniref:glycosyltransferase family 2 protein n=1 Tax=unclassified Campylobacter TaxID=2593542 RepID=UPI0022E9DE5C|nr:MULTISPECIES: glycosyltransferase [unclassified Campylobacter]MDA3057749.1 glycosyltransferase [Campylobacter sp. VBCF_04 NA7]MDA3058877.1 glycosyltransferase [Campylobacter sp. VBCF_05 NA6]